MRVLNLTFFHFKLMIKNNYFVTLLFTTTISILLLQYVVAYSQGDSLGNLIWLRSGIFGMYSVVITSIGLIGFQRRQQTLMYLLNNKTSDKTSILCLLIAPSILGIFAFLISFIMSMILGLEITNFNIDNIIAIIFLLIGCMIMSFIFACFSIFTKNAMIYEPLITLPILIMSGLFYLDSGLNDVISMLGWVIPISGPINFLLGNSDVYILKTCVSIILWLILTSVFTTYFLNKAKETGKLGEI